VQKDRTGREKIRGDLSKNSISALLTSKSKEEKGNGKRDSYGEKQGGGGVRTKGESLVENRSVGQNTQPKSESKTGKRNEKKWPLTRSTLIPKRTYSPKGEKEAKIERNAQTLCKPFVEKKTKRTSGEDQNNGDAKPSLDPFSERKEMDKKGRSSPYG